MNSADEEAAMLDEMLREDQAESRAAGAPSLGEQAQPAQPSPQAQSRPIVMPIRQELIARWPDGKTLVVAKCLVFKDGTRQQREEWRPATEEEKKLIPAGAIIAGGLAAQPETEPAKEEKKGWPWWAKVLAGVVGVGAAGGVGYYLWTSEDDGSDDGEE